MTFKKELWIVLLIIGCWGCDKISNPVKTVVNNSTLPSSKPTYIDSSSSNYTTTKVLLEDYMGHFCINCPRASNQADSLINPAPGFDPTLANNIVMIQNHEGYFAEVPPVYPIPSNWHIPSYAFAHYYQCQADSLWGVLFSVESWPTGMINRKYYPNLAINQGNWNNVIDTLLNFGTIPTAKVAINIHDSCWVPQRIIGAEFQVTFKQVFTTGTYLLEALIVEDSIADWQADNLVAAQYDSTYIHRNVLRGAFDLYGVGTQIPANISTTANSTWTSYQTYDFTKGEYGKAAGWNMAHCHIVAFVYNQATYEVVQAEQIKME